MPIVVVTTNHRVAAQCNVVSSLVPMYLPEMGTSDETLPMVLNTIRKLGIAALETGDLESDQVVIMESIGTNPMIGIDWEDRTPIFKVKVVGDELASLIKPTGYEGDHTISFCSTKIGLENIAVSYTHLTLPTICSV